MSNPCLILEWSDAGEWRSLFTGEPPHLGMPAGPQRIPDERRPAMLQPDRETAEAEAKRLAANHPERRFAIFEVTSEARCVEVPTHTTVAGAVFLRRQLPVIVSVDDDEVPF